jgi:hypothetical protein
MLVMLSMELLIDGRVAGRIGVEDPRVGSEGSHCIPGDDEMTLLIRVNLDGDDDLGIEERDIDLPADTPARHGYAREQEPLQEVEPTLFAAACLPLGLSFVEAQRIRRPRRAVWLTAEQSPSGKACWWDCEVEPLWAQCERLQAELAAERPP